MYRYEGLQEKGLSLWQACESYLHIMGISRKVKSIDIHNNTITARDGYKDSEKVALKITTYVLTAGIAPLIALMIRTAYRCSYNVKIHVVASDLGRFPSAPQEVQRNIHAFASKYLTALELHREYRPDPDYLLDFASANNEADEKADIDSILGELRGSLKDKEMLQKNFRHIINLVCKITQQFIQTGSSQATMAAKECYLLLASFLKKQLPEKDLLEYTSGLNSYAVRQTKGEEIVEYGCNRFNASFAHIFQGDLIRGYLELWFVLKTLRRRLVLNEADKIQRFSTLQFNATDAEVKEAQSCLPITFVHGTKTSVIKTALEKTESQLLPAGMLLKNGVIPFTGEVAEGLTRINRTAISGSPITYAGRSAVTYAGDKFKFNLVVEQTHYQDFLKLSFKNEPDFSRGDNYLSRQIEGVIRFTKMNPQKVDREAMKRKLSEIYQSMAALMFTNKSAIAHQGFAFTGPFYRILQVISKLDEFLANPSVGLTDAELRGIEQDQPLVVGIENRLPGCICDASRKDEEIRELAFPGPLEFGREITHLFTADGTLPKDARDALIAKELLDKVKLHTYKVLGIAQQMDHCLHPQLHDVLNHVHPI